MSVSIEHNVALLNERIYIALTGAGRRIYDNSLGAFSQLLTKRPGLIHSHFLVGGDHLQ